MDYKGVKDIQAQGNRNYARFMHVKKDPNFEDLDPRHCNTDDLTDCVGGVGVAITNLTSWKV